MVPVFAASVGVAVSVQFHMKLSVFTSPWPLGSVTITFTVSSVAGSTVFDRPHVPSQSCICPTVGVTLPTVAVTLTAAGISGMVAKAINTKDSNSKK